MIDMQYLTHGERDKSFQLLYDHNSSNCGSLTQCFASLPKTGEREGSLRVREEGLNEDQGHHVFELNLLPICRPLQAG